jgi:hypothetical protein
MGHLFRIQASLGVLLTSTLFALPSVALATGTSLIGVTHDSVQTGDTSSAILADLDRDGDGDLIVAADREPLRLFRNDGARGFIDITSTVQLPPLWGGGFRVAAGDLDRDGDVDLVSCSATWLKQRTSSICRILLSQLRQSGELRFTDATDRVGVILGTERSLPLIVDFDNDGDPDIFLFGWDRGVQAHIFRNDLADGVLQFRRLADDALPSMGPTRQVAIVDQAGRGGELFVSRLGRADQFLVLDADHWVYSDQASARGLARGFSFGPTVAVADFDGNRHNDLLLHEGLFGPRLLLQDESGLFHDRTNEAGGLNGRTMFAAPVAAEDFDRDGRPDIFVSGGPFSPSQLLLNEGPTAGGEVPQFHDATTQAGIDDASFASAASVFRRAAECDWQVDLAVASANRSVPSRVHHFPDDSAGHTMQVDPGTRVGAATMEAGCVRGSAAGDRLLGHRVASMLDGADGNDTLVARAGLTVMTGGPGADHFEAAGVSFIRLPPGDIEPGETIDCTKADEVIIDSPLTRARLLAAGVEFVNCFGEGACDAAEIEPTGEGAGAPACHSEGDRVTVLDLRSATPFVALQWGLDLRLVADYGIGFGSCHFDADCYAIGLDVCRTPNGGPTGPDRSGNCYPSSFDGFVGPVLDWCADPFWARYRFEQMQEIFQSQGRRLVVPVIFWLPRSSAAASNGSCSIPGHPAPPSVAAWHQSIADAMSSALSTYQKWGVTVDYQVRTFDVPSNSPFIADPDTDACRTALDFADGAENSPGALVQANPTKYRPGEINVYLADQGGGAGSGVSEANPLGDQEVRFIILYGSANALRHELGHKIGLAHPYTDNLAASGTDPGTESRDSWLFRPFPDATLDRLHRCSNDAQCAGIDAAPGVCRKAPGAALGFCQNLKQDCAQDGDTICDTPWDARPCFEGVDNRLGAACATDADCHKVGKFRGTSYLTRCAASGYCVHNACTQNEDCGDGSFCAGGYCVIWKSGVGACCDLHTDRGSYEHNACVEKRPNGTVVFVPGVGPATTWPIINNEMGYHPSPGQGRTLTDGQRDRVVCKLSYRQDLGTLLRLQNPTGAMVPCSLRPGDDVFDFAESSVRSAHGACASGVCVQQPTFVASCVTSTCSDGVLGAAEAGIDCAGACPNACPTYSTCSAGADCVAGICTQGACEATCEDGAQTGSELGVDAGGFSFDPTCSTQPTDGLCRFDADCAASSSCDGDGACVLATDCPINQVEAACEVDGDCLGNMPTCVVLEHRCSTASCAADAQCPSGICRLPAGRCTCDAAQDCPIGGDTCDVARSFCTGQCVDGRCLGTCKLGIGL